MSQTTHGQVRGLGNIYVQVKTESILYYRYTYEIINRDDIRDEDIECLKSELKKTGLVKSLKIKIMKAKDGLFDLVIMPKEYASRNNLIINKIEIKNFGEKVNTESVKETLCKKGIHPGISIAKLPYSELYGLVLETLNETVEQRENIPPSSRDSDTFSSVWVGIEAGSSGKVKIVVMPQYHMD
jgi:hypothetical protein